MKQETSKKSGKWLWLVIGLVALVAAVGVVLALVLGGNQPAEPTNGRPDLYWNLDRETFMADGAVSSLREQAEDGYFHIRFAHNGEQVEILTQDKQLVNFIDTMDVMGLVFDGDGNVVDALPIKKVATAVSETVFVQKTEGSILTINSSIVMNGMKKEFEIPADAAIYDVTTDAQVRGGAVTMDQLGVMDKVSIYGDMDGNITHVYVISHPRQSKIYWRANQFTSGGKTTREKDENGCYTIPFFCEGERVEFKCKNEVEVSYVDKQSRYSAHFGLVFDEEGYIEEAILTYEAIRGTVRSERYDVTAIDGNNITTTKIIGSNAGTTDSFTITDDVKIYDVSPAAQAEDRQGKEVDSLQLGDRIVCFADAEGNPQVIYVSERIVEEAIWCYNIERQYDSTLQETKRTPDSNGYYTFKVFAEGQVRYVKTKDKAVATEIDAIGAKVMGLTLDGDEIVNVYTVYSVFGYSHAGQGRYVSSISGAIYTCFKTSAPNTAITGVMAADCKIWNLSEVGTYGEETKLQYGDYIYAYQNPNLEIVQIWVMKRLVEYPIYYGVSRMYNSTTKETTRVPDEDGWYVYEVYRNGKPTTVKTQSKAMASKIDAINPAVMALNVGSNGVVYDAYAAQLATGGYRRAHTYTVASIKDNVVETTYKSSDGTIATRTLTLDQKCDIINMTTLDFGQKTNVRVGDRITAFTDIYDRTVILVVTNRKSDYLYWNKLKLYDDDKAISLREPDADGWYVYTLARNDGKVVTLKTQDKTIADKVDYYGGAFTLNVKDGVILGVGSPSYAKNTNGSSILNYDVVKIDGRKVTLQYHAEGSSSDGKIQTITLASNAKVFEVGPDAGTFGAQTKLKVGDRVRAYKSDKDDTYTFVFIRFRDSRKDGVDGYCEVCKKNVYWTPWVGGSFSTAGGHFYLPADVETTYLPCSTGRSSLPTCTVCLDLNGHTYYRTNGRAMYVYANATLNIQDCAGGGMVTSSGIKLGTSGGVLGIAGGTVNFYGGTLKLAEEHVDLLRGGVLYVGTNSSANAVGQFNMYGGTITGGEVLGRGGNISVSGGILNIYDGVIENGNVVGGYSGEHGGGGNILTMSNATVNMYGGTVTGGTCYASGGNVYAGTGVFNLYGGTISGGTAKTAGGGNIYALEKLNLYGGTVVGGESQAKSGGNIAIYKQESYQGAFHAENCVIADGKGIGYGGNIYCEVGGTMEGVTLKGGSAKNGGNMYGSGTWVVKDCIFENGTATAGYGGNISGSGTWDLYDVTVIGGTSSDRGGNIHANGAKLKLHSGVISGGTSGTGNSNGGGNIFVVGSATVEIAGGQVIGGTSVNTAGNILVGTGTLKVTGGEITGGTAATKAPGIYAYYNKSNVEVTGGHIDALTYTDAETFKISGNPVIDLLEIESGKAFELGDLTAGADITVAATGIFSTANANAQSYVDAGYVKLADTEKNLVVDADRLSVYTLPVGAKIAPCTHCNEDEVTWYQFAGEFASGHYYLADNFTQEVTYGVVVAEGTEVVLDLAGKSIIGDKVRAIDNSGNLFIMDTVGGGEIVTGGNTENNSLGGVIRVRKGVLTLMGGTLRLADDHSNSIQRGGVIYIDDAGTVRIKDGTVSNGVTTERGGNIFVEGGGARLIVEGGLITNGTAGTGNSNGGGNIAVLSNSFVEISGGTISNGRTEKNAGNIVATGNLTISGGTITGGQAGGVGQDIYSLTDASTVVVTGGTVESLTSKNGATLQISGDPKISNLELVEGQVIQLGDLTTGADITVSTVPGTFTTENANAQSYVDGGNIKLCDTTLTLAVEGNKLVASSIPAGATVAPCVHCGGADALWYKWDSSCTDGHYYLDSDVSVSTVTLPAGGTLVLDLKGNTLSNTEGQVFVAKGNLAIMDTVGGGEIQGAGTANGAVINADTMTFDLYSGTLRYIGQGVGPTHGGVLYLKAVTANLRGGEIRDGKVKDRGGNVYITGSTVEISGTVIANGYSDGESLYGGGNVASLGSSTLNITGGKLIGGSAVKNGGNLLAGSGTITISGGEITGGEAPVGDDIVSYLAASSGTLNITGGKIGSVAVIVSSNGALTVSGKPTIETLNINGGLKINLGELTDGADITVNAEGVFTNDSDYAASALAERYVKTFDKHVITLAGKTLSVTRLATAYCEHCQKEVTWTAWDGVATDGHFYLASDLSVEARVNPPKASVLVIDLNGKTFQNTATKVFSLKGTLAILDSVGCGEVIGSGVTGSSNMNGGVIYMESNATFELYGGTLRHNPGTGVAYRGGVLYVSASTVNLKGGTILGGKTTERGGNIYATGSATVINLSGTTITGGESGTENSVGGGNLFATSSAKVNMTGGKIVDGVSPNNGANVSVGTGTFTMTGGEITGGTAPGVGADLYIYYSGSNADIRGGKIGTLTYTDAASFKLSGNPVIEKFEIAEGKLVTLGELTDGAKIAIAASATGAVTAQSDNIQTYLEKEYFIPASASIALSVDNKQLVATIS